MQRRAGFTLIEIAIAVFILMLLLLLAIPSVTGVLANRRLQSSLDAMNRIVRLAQEHSVQEHRSYLIEWQKKSVILRPESIAEGDPDVPTATLVLDKGQAYCCGCRRRWRRIRPPNGSSGPQASVSRPTSDSRDPTARGK